MQEIFIGLIMALDVVALYLLLPDVKSRFFLSMWTAILHMVFPIIGYSIGHWMLQMIMQWANLISSILLFSIGLHLILSTKKRDIVSIPLFVLSLTASLDTFSVSVSFGMLNLQKYLFIISAGVWTFILSYISLRLAKSKLLLNGDPLKWLAGISLISIGIYTFIQHN